jgi:hypothetical protein
MDGRRNMKVWLSFIEGIEGRSSIRKVEARSRGDERRRKKLEIIRN